MVVSPGLGSAHRAGRGNADHDAYLAGHLYGLSVGGDDTVDLHPPFPRTRFNEPQDCSRPSLPDFAGAAGSWASVGRAVGGGSTAASPGTGPGEQPLPEPGRSDD